MKKISFIAAALTAVLGFSSCSETWDDNPVLKTHEGIVKADFLNEPAMQSAPVMITEANSTSNFNLTCSQPDFGYAASAAYVVQMSLTEDFAQYEELKQRFYNCAQINPVYSDVASALEKLSGLQSENDLPLAYQKVYMRLRCFIPQSEDNTQYISNVVHYDAIAADYMAIWVANVPVNLWLRGSINGWFDPTYDATATTAAEWQFVTYTEEDSWVYRNVTLVPGDEFKAATNNWATPNLGSGNAGDTVTPGTKLELADGGGNLKVSAPFTGDVVVSLSEGKYYMLLIPAE